MKRRYVSVELDVVLNEGETIGQAMRSMTFGFDVSIYCTTAVGPGGGHPIVRVTGPRAQVLALLDNGGYDDLEPYTTALDL
jgi:hypothetical protein